MSKQFYDKRGVPIHDGDLIKSPHFIDNRGKKYYLYHVAVLVDGYYDMVPTAHLQPSLVKDGGRCRMSQNLVSGAEVIDGHGPGDILDFRDRPRRKASEEANQTGEKA